MRKPKEIYKGKSKYAREGCECRICKKWLEKGERKANQFLCCNDDSRDLTECQIKYYKDKRAKKAKLRPKPNYGFVICDVCRKTVKKTDPMQKRCTSGIKGVLSTCQKAGMRRTCNKKGNKDLPTKKRTCLKCREKFDSFSPYNRICPPCADENNEITKPEHRIHIEDDCASGDINLEDIYGG